VDDEPPPPPPQAVPSNDQILDALRTFQQPNPQHRDIASKVVAPALNVPVERVRRLYSKLDEKYKARRGRPRNSGI
jgi:hypothetical protein